MITLCSGTQQPSLSGEKQTCKSKGALVYSNPWFCQPIRAWMCFVVEMGKIHRGYAYQIGKRERKESKKKKTMIVCFVFLKYQLISGQFRNTVFSGWTNDSYKWYEGHRTSSKITVDHQTALQLGISCIEPSDLLTDRDSCWIDFTVVRKWIRPVSDILMLAKHAVFTAQRSRIHESLKENDFCTLKYLFFSFNFFISWPLVTQVNWVRWPKCLKTLFRSL